MPLTHRLFVAFFISLFVMTAGCSTENDTKVDAYIKNARQFIARKKPQTAIIEYRNAISIAPNNDVALFELAEAYVLTRQINAAVRYYKLAAKANPRNILPLLRLAQVFMQTGQLIEAREHISKALEINPTSIEALHLLAGVQIKERDTDSAIETLNKALSLDNENVKTYVSLAQLHLKNNDPVKAEQVYLTALSHDSASRAAYMGLVRLYGLQKKWDKAEDLLKKVMETPGNTLKKYTDIANFYQGQKKYDLAEEYFQKAVRFDDGRVEPLINLAEFYARQQKADKAIETMERALAKLPKSPLILSGLSQIYLRFNRVDEAEKTVAKALEINGENEGALLQQGRVMMAQKNFKEALNRFDQVISMNRLNAKAYYYRAACIGQRGATDRPEQEIFRAAVGMLDQPEEFEIDQIKGNLLAAITVDPSLLDARIKLLEIYILEKNLTKAKEQMQEIFKLSAPNIRIMTLLSGIHLLEGDTQGAQKILENIIKNRPGYLPAYIRLGMLYSSLGKPDKAFDYLKKAFDMKPDQVGIVKMMVDIYMGRGENDQALKLADTYAERLFPEKKAFFDNLKGEIYLASRQSETALHFFEKAASQEPRFIQPRMHMARLMTGQKKLNQALEQYQQIESVNPAHVPTLISMGVIYDTLGNVNKAEEYYRKVLELNPKHAEAANNLAFILSERKKDVDEAFEYAAIAREKDPKNPNVLDTMGWVFYQKGNYLNALSELEESLKIKPESALACFHYGMALYRTKAFEKARQYFKKALDIDPKFKDSETARQMLN
nr:tetratricopeptide repeat protein [uncultured Desulfobacter sp.]